MPEPWQVIGSRITYQDRWLRVRSDRCQAVDGRVIEPYHVLEYPDWLDIVALTPTHEIVLIREYRHGAGEVLTGLPAGMTEPGDSGPEQAARRELREETGYTGGRFYALPPSYANPAKQGNMIHPFLAVGVRQTDLPRPDPSEEIEVIREDFLGLVGRLWHQGVVFQASHLAALHQAIHFILGGSASGLDALRDRLREEWRHRYDLVHPTGDGLTDPLS
ncbi:MAG: NUDIX hydrolase [Isosphaeraceae bacterium]|nr:NUDIX hydrolase [Isosphaeraceae bacterium]